MTLGSWGVDSRPKLLLQKKKAQWECEQLRYHKLDSKSSFIIFQCKFIFSKMSVEEFEIVIFVMK